MTDRDTTRHVLRKAARILGTALASVLGLVLLILMALQIAPLRETILAEALRRADSALPGDLRAGSLRWPGFGHIQLGDILWTTSTDTLAAAGRLEVEVDVPALLRRDVRVRALVGQDLYLDLPALQAAMPPKTDSVRAEEPKKGSRSFPREGALPGVPSIAVEGIAINARTLRLSPDRTVRALELEGAIDLRHGTQGRIDLKNAALAMPEDSVSLDALTVSWMPRQGANGLAGGLQASGGGSLGQDFPFALEARTTGDGAYRLALTRQTGVEPPDAMGVVAEGVLDLAPQSLERVTADFTIKTPDTRELASIPLLRPALGNFPELKGLLVTGRAEVALQPRRSGQVRLRLHPNGYVRDGRIAARFDHEEAEVDTLSLDFEDLALVASARLRGAEQQGQLEARVRGVRWLAPFVDTATLPDSTDLHLAANLAGRAERRLVDAQLRGGIRRQGLRVQDIAVDLAATIEQSERASGNGSNASGSPNGSGNNPSGDRASAPGNGSNVSRNSTSAPGNGGGSSSRAAPSRPPAGLRIDSQLALSARTSGFGVSAAGRVQLGDRLEARLRPITLIQASPGRSPSLPRLPERGELARGEPTFAMDPTSGVMEVRDLRIQGDLGNVTASGDFDKVAGGAFDVAVLWPEPPRLLLDRLAEKPEAAREMIERWSREGAFHVTARAELTPQNNGMEVLASGELALPGPATVRGFLPTAARVDDLGPIRGNYSVEVIPATSAATSTTSNTSNTGDALAGAPPAILFSLDLGQTDWVREFQARGRKEGPLLLLESVGIEIEDLMIRGASRMGAGGVVDGGVNLALAGPHLLRRFVPALGDSADTRLEGRINFAGTREQPVITTEMGGVFRMAALDLPRIDLSGTYAAPSDVSATILLPEGLQAGSFVLDSVGVLVDPLPRRSVPDREAPGKRGLMARVQLGAFGPDLALTHTVQVIQEAGWRLLTDSMRVVTHQKDLATTRPFLVHLREDSQIEIRDLDLAGSLGTMTARGIYGAAATDFEVRAALVPPEEPPLPAIPAGLWPSGLNLRLRAIEGDSLFCNIEAEGLKIGVRDDVRLSLRLQGLADRLQFLVNLAGGEDTFLQGSGFLAGSVSMSPPKFVSRNGEFAAAIVLDEFPLPAQPGSPMTAPGYLDGSDPKRNPVLDARVTAAGTTAEPVAQIAGLVRFPEYDDLRDHRLAVQARLLPANRAVWGEAVDLSVGREPSNPAIRDTFPEIALSNLPALPQARAGLIAGIRALRGETEIMNGSVLVPQILSLAPPGATPVAGAELLAELHGRDVELDDLTPLVATVRSLDGKVAFDLAARGDMKNPSLEGEVRLNDAEASMRNGSRAVADGRVTASGTLQAPVIRGRVEIANGVIQIPEASKTLIALDGTALLWEREDFAAASPEGPFPREMTEEEQSLYHREAGTRGPAAPALADADTMAATSEEPPPDIMKNLDMSVTVVIPSGVWLEGRGLEVELTGDIELVQRAGAPVLLGSLRAEQGKMEFQGVGLNIQGGTVTFYGDEQLNPSLDLTLVKRQSDVTVTATIGGTVLQPTLELDSDPEMAQSDIFAFLLFGKREENLSSEQNKSLEARAMATAEQFAASRLATRISQELGLDMVSYQQSEGDTTGRSIAVGKYLSPNLLVRYEQTLDQESAFDVVIQYWIGNGWSVETRTRRNEQSGIMLGWEQDF